MQSIFAKFGAKKKKRVRIAVTVDQHSVVFAVAHADSREFVIETYGTRQASSLSGVALLEDLFSYMNQRFFIEEVTMSFAAPYFEIKSHEQNVVRAHASHEITGTEARRIARVMTEKTERLVRRRIFEETGILPADFTIQRSNILRWNIDGYAVKAPEGFKGREITGLVLGTFLRQDYVSLVSRLKKRHHINRIAVLHPFEGMFRQNRQGVFVYMTEEKTQIFASRNGTLSLSDSFSPGGDYFRSAIREEFGMPENIAAEFEERYIQGKISEDARSKMHEVLLPEIRNFGKLIIQKLELLKVIDLSPIFFFGNAVRLMEIRDIFLEGQNAAILRPRDADATIDFPKELDARYTPLLFLFEMAFAKVK